MFADRTRKILILIRSLNLGFALVLILLALINLIWAKATNGSEFMSDYLFGFVALFSIIIPLVLFYFLIKRYIDKLKMRISSKPIIILELVFVILSIIGLLLAQIGMFIHSFDIVVFLGLLFGEILLFILALDSIKDYKIQFR